jgi:hypothetical protein
VQKKGEAHCTPGSGLVNFDNSPSSHVHTSNQYYQASNWREDTTEDMDCQGDGEELRRINIEIIRLLHPSSLPAGCWTAYIHKKNDPPGPSTAYSRLERTRLLSHNTNAPLNRERGSEDGRVMPAYFNRRSFFTLTKLPASSR